MALAEPVARIVYASDTWHLQSPWYAWCMLLIHGTCRVRGMHGVCYGYMAFAEPVARMAYATDACCGSCTLYYWSLVPMAWPHRLQDYKVARQYGCMVHGSKVARLHGCTVRGSNVAR